MALTRKLLPTEGPLLAEHLMRLSADDRRLRFGGMLLRDDAVRRYVDSIDWTHSWHVGCFAEGELRAVVQLSVPRAGGYVGSPWLRPGAAEFAVSVEIDPPRSIRIERTIEAARLLTLEAALKRDLGEPATKNVVMAKQFATEAAVRAARTAISLHGGVGYLAEYPVEGLLRDAIGLSLYEGTTQIQKLILGRELLGVSAF